MNATDRLSDTDSRLLQRTLAGVVALPLTAIVVLILRNQLHGGFDPLGSIVSLCAATAGALCYWYVFLGNLPEHRARMRYALLGGFILGGIGFAAGFFGPIFLTPRSNQGPLLGIFFTGPLGFIIGVAIGSLYAHFRVRRARQVVVLHTYSANTNMPNQAPEPTPTTVTPPAGQEARQP